MDQQTNNTTEQEMVDGFDDLLQEAEKINESIEATAAGTAKVLAEVAESNKKLGEQTDIIMKELDEAENEFEDTMDTLHIELAEQAEENRDVLLKTK